MLSDGTTPLCGDIQELLLGSSATLPQVLEVLEASGLDIWASDAGGERPAEWMLSMESLAPGAVGDIVWGMFFFFTVGDCENMGRWLAAIVECPWNEYTIYVP